MKRILVTTILIVALTGSAVMVIASSSGPPSRRTGAPAIGTHAAEADCTDCHSGSVNSGGNIRILGLPGSWDVNTTYPLTIRITSSRTAGDANRRWGFEVTAVRLDNGDGVGTLAPVDADSVTLVTADNREYLRHNSNGNKRTFPSPQEWRINWTSPGTIVGAVGFYVAGLAGNGSGSGGDWTYTFGDTLFDVTPVHATTWGEIKNRYRR